MYDQLLLTPLAVIVDGGFWRTLGICLFICPILPQLLGVVGASYWPPLNPFTHQFWAYFPGNPCLALFIALTSTTFEGGDFKINPVFNWIALIGAGVIYLVLWQMDKKVYSKGQLLSANKRYHNALYFWYGYLAAMCAGEMFQSSAALQTKLLITLPGALWVVCLLKDALFTSREVLEQKWLYAHADNVPLWETGWRLRRRTATGYAPAA